MRRAVIIFIFLLICGFTFGQQKGPKPPAGPPSDADNGKARLNYQCLYTERYTAKARRAFYPFGTAVKVKLISFEYLEPHESLVRGADGSRISVRPANLDTVAVITPMAANNYAINYRKVIEEKTLSIAGIDSLTDLLYNVGFTPVKNLAFQIVKEASCYEPRNAILFLNADGKVTQYIKFCFECKRHYYSSSKTQTVNYCEQKYDMLREFFFGQGVKYTPKRDDD